VAAYVVSIIAPAVLVLAVLSTGVDPRIVLRDPIAAMGGSAAQLHYGMLSNLGVLVWAAAGSICLFVAATDRERLSTDGRQFLICAGILTSILTIDDLFMLHENMDGAFAYLPYVLGWFYLYRFGNIILSLDTALIVAAIAFMGMSVAMDLLIELRAQWNLSGQSDLAGARRDRSEPPPSFGIGFMEDVFKFLGICSWSVFHVRAASLLRRRPALKRGSPER
jgi:hypothetical protein